MSSKLPNILDCSIKFDDVDIERWRNNRRYNNFHIGNHELYIEDILLLVYVN
jgi:hypothetical protein